MQINADEHEFSVRCIRLADGSLIDPLTREPVVGASSVKRNRKEEKPVPQQIEDDTRREAEAAIDAVFEVAPTSRRSIHDIVLPRNQMALVCMIITFERWGLPDDEIIQFIGTTYDALAHVRNLTMYRAIADSLTQSMRNAYMSSVEGVLQQASMKAALKMVSFISDIDGDRSMAAAKDVLDRTNHRPADRVEHVHSGEQSLIVRVIEERQEDKLLNVIEL